MGAAEYEALKTLLAKKMLFANRSEERASPAVSSRTVNISTYVGGRDASHALAIESGVENTNNDQKHLNSSEFGTLRLCMHIVISILSTRAHSYLRNAMQKHQPAVFRATLRHSTGKTNKQTNTKSTTINKLKKHIFIPKGISLLSFVLSKRLL